MCGNKRSFTLVSCTLAYRSRLPCLISVYGSRAVAHPFNLTGSSTPKNCAMTPMTLKSTAPGNHLIDLLPKKDRLRLMAACELVDLPLAEVLSQPGKPTKYVYFPTVGFVSLIAMVKDSPGVEVGMVGREGMLGVQLALGVATAPLHALVQGAGTALRIATKAFKLELAASPALQSELHRYLYVLMAQLAESAACVRFHQIGPRLARWLLMSQDRSQASSFDMTQQFLAYMLGVRRVGITTAAGALQKSGLISYSRGKLTVLNRKGLERVACGCYAADQKAYSELL